MHLERQRPFQTVKSLEIKFNFYQVRRSACLQASLLPFVSFIYLKAEKENSQLGIFEAYLKFYFLLK